MSEQAKFDHTVQVLVQAYLNETLEKDNCQACAVGVLIAHAAGAVYVRKPNDYNGDLHLEAQPRIVDWLGAICTSEDCDQDLDKQVYLNQPNIKAAFDSTGYSFEQLARIEYTFVSNDGDDPMASDAERQYVGLMAVVDVLADIHGLDLTAATQAKARFVRA